MHTVCSDFQPVLEIGSVNIYIYIYILFPYTHTHTYTYTHRGKVSAAMMIT